MLRITPIASKGAVILRLEGKLIGPWVNELKSYCQTVREGGSPLSLEMTEVSFADRSGLALLRGLKESGVELADCPPLISEELER
jgi:anti-anti-sigma regulatory factor